MTNVLPRKLPQYLVRLQMELSRKGDRLGELIAHSRFLCVEDTTYDNWDGGQSGHDVVLFLPLHQLTSIDIDEQDVVRQTLTEKLNKCGQGIERESFNQVLFELVDEDDHTCQQATPFSKNPPVNPDKLAFWKSGLARVFISHRDSKKVEARALADALRTYGFSCFVAHDTIMPMKTWQSEILKGLQTMEIMLAYITDDFDESRYCHQEIGYALGAGKPIIPLKVGKKDPPGFLADLQAVRANPNLPIEAARKLFPFLSEALDKPARVQEVLVNNFAAAPSFVEAKARFEMMDARVSALTDGQAQRIVQAFRDNSQLHDAGYLRSSYERLSKFMTRTAGGEWTIDGKNLSQGKAIKAPKLTLQWLDELRSRITLSSVIGQSVKLIRAGREYKACCPFHSEKTPSFIINDEKGFYHCFGCGAHGDAIRFLTDQRGLPFQDAVKELADKAGLPLPSSNSDGLEDDVPF